MSDISMLVLLPLLAAVGATATPHFSGIWGLLTTAFIAIIALMLALNVLHNGAHVVAIGNWIAPLGIVFVADGLAALMIVMTAGVGIAVAIQATSWGVWPSSHMSEKAGSDRRRTNRTERHPQCIACCLRLPKRWPHGQPFDVAWHCFGLWRNRAHRS